MKIENMVVTQEQISKKLLLFTGVEDRVIINTAIEKNRELLEKVSSKQVKKKLKVVISGLEATRKVYNLRGKLMKPQEEQVLISLGTALVYLDFAV